MCRVGDGLQLLVADATLRRCAAMLRNAVRARTARLKGWNAFLLTLNAESELDAS